MSLPVPVLPSEVGAYKLTGGSFSVTLPSTVSSNDDAVALTSYSQEIPGLDGLFAYRNPTFQGRSMLLSGPIFDANTVASLKRVLSNKRITIERDNRVADAELASFSIVERVYSSIWVVSLELIALKPWWSAKSFSVESSVSFSSPHSITVENAGDVLVFPTFTIVGGSGGLASISFELDGRSVLWSGNLSEGEELVIDCLNRTATIDLVNALADMDEDFLIDPLRIAPGSHLIGVTFVGTYDSYVISWKELFL